MLVSSYSATQSLAGKECKSNGSLFRSTQARPLRLALLQADSDAILVIWWNVTNGKEVTMYTLQIAASILRISQSTLRNWIAQANIQTIPVEIDRRRMYLSRRDLINLAAAHQRKIAPPTTLTELPKNHPDPDLYTLAEAAQCLDISPNALKEWLKQDNIEKRYITTDRKRIYITVY